MMLRKVTAPVLLIFVMLLAGCATGRKQMNLETQGLKNQISVLEAQVQSKDQEIANLRDSLNKTEEANMAAEKNAPKKKVIGEVKSHPNHKQIQIALRNAGFYSGKIDGKMGGQTREGIKAFQKANNLHADGKVGGKTWAALKDYLYKKTK